MKKKSIPIFLAADDNYAPFVLTTILSIMDNTTRDISFFILDGGITQENVKKIQDACSKITNCELFFTPVDTDKLFKDFYTIGYISLSTYSRFLAPQMFPNIDKAIYMDVDIIVKGDISKLYDIDLGEFALGAVPEQVSKKCLIEPKQKVGMKDESVYFNAGVLLIDMDKWRKLNIIDSLLEIEKEYHDNGPNDQDVLNRYFEDNYLKLDRQFNWEATKEGDYIVRHYIGIPKPWNTVPDQCVGLFNDYMLFWDYLKRTPYYEKIRSNCKEMTKHQMQFQQVFRTKVMFVD